MQSNLTERLDETNEDKAREFMDKVVITPINLVCHCGYDLKVSGHCGCGKYFSICLDCHLPTRANKCTCKTKTRNVNYPEEWS